MTPIVKSFGGLEVVDHETKRWIAMPVDTNLDHKLPRTLQMF